MTNHSKFISEKEAGFTLVELLIVVVIIGILAAIAIPIFVNQQKAAKDTALKSDVRTVASAQVTYMTQNSSSPGTNSLPELSKLVPSLSRGTIIGTWVVPGKGFCVAGKNLAGSFDGELTSPAGKYIWYDSALGGLNEGARTGSPPADGACVAVRDNPAWYYSEETNHAVGWFH